MLFSSVGSGSPGTLSRIVTKTLFSFSVAAPLLFSLVLLAAGSSAQANQSRFSEEIANTVMTRWKHSWEPQPGRTEKWSYDQGVVLKGMEGLWLNTADGKYFRFIQQSIDRFVKDDGTIRTYLAAFLNAL